MAYEKLTESPCWEEVRARLKAGVVPRDIAAWAHSEGCLMDMKIENISRTLYRYKRKMLPLTGNMIAASTNKDGKPDLYIWKRIEEAKRGLNELEELEKLYLLQLTRIDQAVKVEEKIQFLDKGTRREMEVAHTILEKMADLKFKLGIYNEAPKQLNINATSTHTSVVESIPPEKREVLAGAARSVLQALLNPGSAQTPAEAQKVAEEPAEADYEVVSDEVAE